MPSKYKRSKSKSPRRKRKSRSKSLKRKSPSRSKSNMRCNRPQKSWRPGKKRVVKACSKGREKLIHYGATGYSHNYSPSARKSFRARHRCNSATDKLTARYWACKLWTRGGSKSPCPKGRQCKSGSYSRYNYHRFR